MLSEKEIERRLVKAVRDSGGLAVKFVSPGMAGVPDRLLLFPGGKAVFCEVKAPGKEPRPLQVRRMEQLIILGFRVYVADSEEKIRELMEDMKKWDCPSYCGALEEGLVAGANPMDESKTAGGTLQENHIKGK